MIAGASFSIILFYAVVGASADGATVTLMRSGISPPSTALRYTTSTGILASTGAAFAPFLTTD